MVVACECVFAFVCCLFACAFRACLCGGELIIKYFFDNQSSAERHKEQIVVVVYSVYWREKVAGPCPYLSAPK